MNSNRRAELQRKLSLQAVPTPPAGLAERIKAGIPKDLAAVTGRARLDRASGPMRLAASILLVITSVVVAMYLASPASERKSATTASATRPVIFAPASRGVATETIPSDAVARTEIARAEHAPGEEVTLDIREESPAPQTAPLIADAGLRNDRLQDLAGESDSERRNETVGVEGGAVGAVAAPAAIAPTAAAPAVAEPVAQIAEAAAPPPAPAPGRSAAQNRDRAALATPPPPAEALTVTAAAPRIARQEQAAKMAFGAESDVFGISVNPAVFHGIRATLESGRRPEASAVDVEALVNYFAGQPETRPRNGVRLEVEASPAALEADGDHAVLRFSIDTPPADDRNPVVASDARLEVVVNDAVVRSARRIGDGDALAEEATLLRGTSVTGLYALETKPGLQSNQVVATVSLTYAANGRPQTITRKVHGHDLSGTWQHSSRRHRLATLGAMWGETLKGTAGGPAVARRAEELATQKPDDVLARELARAASASSGGSR